MIRRISFREYAVFPVISTCSMTGSEPERRS